MYRPSDKTIACIAAFAVGYVIGSDTFGTGIVRRVTGGAARYVGGVLSDSGESFGGGRTWRDDGDDLADLLSELDH